jgi:hypothetical protein
MFAVAGSYVKSIVSAWSTRLAILAAGAILLIVALFYFIAAGQAWLALRYDQPIANLIVAGIFLLLGVILVVVGKVKSVKPDTSPVKVAATALAATTGWKTIQNLRANKSGRTVMSKLSLRSILAAGGGGLLLLGQWMRNSRDRVPDVEIWPPEKAIDKTMSAAKAAEQLAAALGRNVKTAAGNAASQWREVEPQIRGAAHDIRELAVPKIIELAQPLAIALFGRRGSNRFMAWMRPHRSTTDRALATLQDMSLNRQTAAQAMAIAAAIIAVAWFMKNNDKQA